MEGFRLKMRRRFGIKLGNWANSDKIIGSLYYLMPCTMAQSTNLSRQDNKKRSSNLNVLKPALVVLAFIFTIIFVAVIFCLAKRICNNFYWKESSKQETN